MNPIEQFDQQATLALNGSHSLVWDNVMSLMTETHAWSLLAAALLIVLFRNNSLRQALIILLAVAFTIALANSISDCVKDVVARPRPTQDPFLMYSIDVVQGRRGGAHGFFSAHAANTFSMAMFLTLLFRHTPAALAVYLWATVHTFTRLYLGVHYLGDVLTGAVVGTLLGAIIYALYALVHRHMGDPALVSGQFTSSGYLRTDLNAFVAFNFLNYILLFIVAAAMGIR